MVQPRKVKGSDKNKNLRKQEQQQQQKVEVVAPHGEAKKGGLDNNKSHHHATTTTTNKVAASRKKNDNYYHHGASYEKKSNTADALNNNPNLTKKDLKMLEKIHAKMEYHEIRDELDELEKLRQQIIAIEDNANMRAMKKAHKLACAAAAMA